MFRPCAPNCPTNIASLGESELPQLGDGAECLDGTASNGALACKRQERMPREGTGESSTRTGEPSVSLMSTVPQALHKYPEDVRSGDVPIAIPGR